MDRQKDSRGLYIHHSSPNPAATPLWCPGGAVQTRGQGWWTRREERAAAAAAAASDALVVGRYMMGASQRKKKKGDSSLSFLRAAKAALAEEEGGGGGGERDLLPLFSCVISPPPLFLPEITAESFHPTLDSGSAHPGIWGRVRGRDSEFSR